MKTLKDYITEASNSSEFKNKRIIKKAEDLLKSSFPGGELTDEQFDALLSAIDKDPEFAEVIIKGKFPKATEYESYGYSNVYDYDDTEVLFSAVKNSYMRHPEYAIKVYGKRYAEVGGTSDLKGAKIDCKAYAILKRYSYAWKDNK